MPEGDTLHRTANGLAPHLVGRIGLEDGLPEDRADGVGRAGHAIGAIPKGRLLPLAHDDLLRGIATSAADPAERSAAIVSLMRSAE